MVIQLDDTPLMECLARSKLAILAMSSSWSSRFADLVVDSNGGEPGEPSKMNCFFMENPIRLYDLGVPPMT